MNGTAPSGVPLVEVQNPELLRLIKLSREHFSTGCKIVLLRSMAVDVHRFLEQKVLL